MAERQKERLTTKEWEDLGGGPENYPTEEEWGIWGGRGTGGQRTSPQGSYNLGTEAGKEMASEFAGRRAAEADIERELAASLSEEEELGRAYETPMEEPLPRSKPRFQEGQFDEATYMSLYNDWVKDGKPQGDFEKWARSQGVVLSNRFVKGLEGKIAGPGFKTSQERIEEAILKNLEAQAAKTKSETKSAAADKINKIKRAILPQPSPDVGKRYLPGTSLVGPGSPNLQRLGFQGKTAGFYTDTQAGKAEMPNVRAGGMNQPPQPVMVARQGTPPSPSNIPAGGLLQGGGFKQPQRMSWNPPQQTGRPNMGDLKNPGNVFGGMKLSQAQGFGMGLKQQGVVRTQQLQTRLPSPMAMPTLGRPTARPTTGLPSPMTRPMQRGVTFSQPTQIEEQLQTGEEIIEQYPNKVKFWIGNKQGWELGDAVITQMQTGAYRFIGIGDKTKSPRSKTIGKDLNNADLIAAKGK